MAEAARRVAALTRNQKKPEATKAMEEARTAAMEAREARVEATKAANKAKRQYGKSSAEDEAAAQKAAEEAEAEPRLHRSRASKRPLVTVEEKITIFRQPIQRWSSCHVL